MNEDVLKEIKEMEERYKKLAEDWMLLNKDLNDHRLITHILNLAGVTRIQTTIADVENDNSLYVCEYNDGVIVVSKKLNLESEGER